MATLEELQVEAAAEIEAAKPLFKQVNNERLEFSDDDYAQAIEDRKNSLLDEYNFGYIQKRQEAYGSIAEQLDMMYWDLVNGTSTWQDHIAQVKADNPKPA